MLPWCVTSDLRHTATERTQILPAVPVVVVEWVAYEELANLIHTLQRLIEQDSLSLWFTTELRPLRRICLSSCAAVAECRQQAAAGRRRPPRSGGVTLRVASSLLVLPHRREASKEVALSGRVLLSRLQSSRAFFLPVPQEQQLESEQQLRIPQPPRHFLPVHSRLRTRLVYPRSTTTTTTTRHPHVPPDMSRTDPSRETLSQCTTRSHESCSDPAPAPTAACRRTSTTRKPRPCPGRPCPRGLPRALRSPTSSRSGRL